VQADKTTLQGASRPFAKPVSTLSMTIDRGAVAHGAHRAGD